MLALTTWNEERQERVVDASGQVHEGREGRAVDGDLPGKASQPRPAPMRTQEGQHGIVGEQPGHSDPEPGGRASRKPVEHGPGEQQDERDAEHGDPTQSNEPPEDRFARLGIRALDDWPT